MRMITREKKTRDRFAMRLKIAGNVADGTARCPGGLQDEEDEEKEGKRGQAN
jgi:hypothetical protein